MHENKINIHTRKEKYDKQFKKQTKILVSNNGKNGLT